MRKLFLELKRGTDDALIFGKQSGGAFKEAPAAFVNVVASLGLNQGRGPRERLTFHSIRHSVATELAKRLSLRELMDTMGWRSVDMAARYMHTNQDNQQRALAGLENLLTAEQARVIPFSKST